ncbi:MULTISPECIES: hypothetical protein [Bacillus cereus group]|uniref:Uncharacterized protein n=1 Tax=Bacillus wiedmannii TaxID=1890302 RepID=A0AA95RVV7_9BACI|nr:hypothetical protein [Bacillus wiedmannii]PER31385.1 hypothetical protein CN490_07985 [Bacillus cereus]WHY30118.1 hypothetical protein QNH45_04920 [Bacillus wiedmannii]
MILILPILLFLLFILYKISKMVSRTVAVLVDFLFLGGFTAYSLHKSVSVKIASGYAVYFWDILFFIVSCVLYYIVLNYLVINFPRIAALINYIISWIGTFLVYTTICIILIGNLPKLLNDEFFSQLTNIIIISILAIITFNIRKTMFANEERNEEIY